jgi:hypothetical protein
MGRLSVEIWNAENANSRRIGGLMSAYGDLVKRTAGLTKKMGAIVAEFEAIHGPFRLFALLTRSAHIPDGGSWSLIASAGWMDDDRAGASQYLGNFIKNRVEPVDMRYLPFVVVKLESESPVFQIQRKLGWVIREDGLVGDIAVEAPAIWVVYRCLPNGEEFLIGDGLEGGQSRLPHAYDLKKSQLDDSVVPIEVQEKIIAMARPSDWAGEGSGAITPEACSASIDFVSLAMKEIDGLEYPRIGPSPSGAVALQWDFDDVSLIVRISSERPGFVHYQEEGPGFHQEEGVASRGDVLARLGAIARKHVLS